MFFSRKTQQSRALHTCEEGTGRERERARACTLIHAYVQEADQSVRSCTTFSVRHQHQQALSLPRRARWAQSRLAGGVEEAASQLLHLIIMLTSAVCSVFKILQHALGHKAHGAGHVQLQRV